MDDIINAINSVYCSIINDINFDVEKKEIIFDLTLEDDCKKTYHSMKFFDVTSFMWIEKPKERSVYNYLDCDFHELTSITLTRISAKTKDNWLNQYLIEYNIAIEIWETALLINASKISIDNKSYLIECSTGDC